MVMIALRAGGCRVATCQCVEATPRDAGHAAMAAAPDLPRDPADGLHQIDLPSGKITRQSRMPSESPSRDIDTQDRIA